MSLAPHVSDVAELLATIGLVEDTDITVNGDYTAITNDLGYVQELHFDERIDINGSIYLLANTFRAEFVKCADNIVKVR
jgi:hypothetical protein